MALSVIRTSFLPGAAVAEACSVLVAQALGRLAGWGAAGGSFGFVGETTLGTVLTAWRRRRAAWRREMVWPKARAIW